MSLAHAIGVLSSLPACRVWPNTSIINQALAPFVVMSDKKHAASRSDGESRQPMVDYQRFLQSHGQGGPNLAFLAELRQTSGVYDNL